MSFQKNSTYSALEAIPGQFTVALGKQVQFTAANLYWDSSAFKFEASQTDYDKGTYYDETMATYTSTHVSHFYWTKTTAASYAETFNDGTTTTSDKFFADGSDADHMLTIEGQSGLYALSKDEWTYLLSSTGRGDGDSKFKFPVTVNGNANCLVIAPDDYSGTIADSYDAAGWAIAESEGLVCLPAAGWRDGSTLEDVTSGCYWSATPYADDNAYYLDFIDGEVTPSNSDTRDCASSVRLVHTAAPSAPVYPEAPKLPCVKIGDVWWAPVNCGYDATNAPTGLFYQWGRKYGQSNTKEMTDADFITTQATSMTAGNTEANKDKFYKGNACWFSENTTSDIWSSEYDPCPAGWRVPTKTELTSLNSSSNWVEGKDITGKGSGSYSGRLFPASGDSQIFFPVAGYRDYSSGSISYATTNGYYWSSSPSTSIADIARYLPIAG